MSTEKHPEQLNETNLTAILNTFQDGVLMVDPSGKVLFANPPMETLLGSPRHEIIGKHLSQLPEKALQAMGISLQQITASSHTDTLQLDPRPQRYQRENTFYERHATLTTGANGQPLGWVLVFRNVTDEQYLAQNREQLTETLIHDMRSPMGAVQTSLELLEETLAEIEHDPVMDQALGIAQRATVRVLTLVNSLMEIRHLDSGQIKISAVPFDLTALVAALVEEILPQSLEDQVFLTYDLPPDLPMVNADPGIIQRVLVNLVDNALKFTPEGGRVWVQAEHKEGLVHVSVTDTGPGIPKRFRQEVFSRFVQVPETRSKRRGAGLGLAYCQAAIEAHGERIWIEPGPEDAGTRVIFSLAIVERG